jgi:hypothetical protein
VRRRRSNLTLVAGLAAILTVVAAGPLAAQELEPRAYAPSPVGITIFGLGAGRSSGELLFDPTIPVTDGHGTVNSAFVSIGRLVGIAGRPVAVGMALPLVWGNATGLIDGVAARADRSGLADLKFRISVNLSGTAALSPQDFARARRRPVIGASLVVSAPTGQYDPAHLVNLGSHRWSFKPEVGLSVPWRRWDLDLYLSTLLFTANGDYYPGGRRRTQGPVVAIQGHATYTIRPRLWVAGDATWYHGGRMSVDEGAPYNLLQGARFGATLALPVSTNQSLKVAYSTGLWTRSGGDFETLGVSWQIAWADRRRP